MSTVDGLLAGFVVGAALTGGAWAFVESESALAPWNPPPRQVLPPSRSKPPSDHQAPAINHHFAEPRPRTRQVNVRAMSPEPRIESPRVDEVPSGTEVVESADEQPIALPAPERRSGLMLTVAAGGGVETPLSPALGNAVRWDLRLSLDPYEHLGFDVAYAGTRGANVESSSIEVISRWYPQAKRDTRYYLLAGVGWRQFRRPFAVDVATLPMGAGVTHVRGRWRVDARLTFRPTNRRTLHTLGATGNVGMMF